MVYQCGGCGCTPCWLIYHLGQAKARSQAEKVRAAQCILLPQVQVEVTHHDRMLMRGQVLTREFILKRQNEDCQVKWFVVNTTPQGRRALDHYTKKLSLRQSCMYNIIPPPYLDRSLRKTL